MKIILVRDNGRGKRELSRVQGDLDTARAEVTVLKQKLDAARAQLEWYRSEREKKEKGMGILLVGMPESNLTVPGSYGEIDFAGGIPAQMANRIASSVTYVPPAEVVAEPGSGKALFPCDGYSRTDCSGAGMPCRAVVSDGEQGWDVAFESVEAIRRDDPVYLYQLRLDTGLKVYGRRNAPELRESWVSDVLKVAKMLGCSTDEAWERLAVVAQDGLLGIAVNGVYGRGIALQVRVGGTVQSAISAGAIAAGGEVQLKIRPGMAIRWEAAATGRMSPAEPRGDARFRSLEVEGEEEP